jgi:hypothetical protein
MAICLGRPLAPQGRSEVWAKNELAMLAIGNGLMQKIQRATGLAVVQILGQTFVEAVTFV